MKFKKPVVKEDFVISIYGPTSYGFGHYTTPYAPINGQISLNGGWTELQHMVEDLVNQGAEIGSTIEVTMKVKSK